MRITILAVALLTGSLPFSLPAADTPDDPQWNEARTAMELRDYRAALRAYTDLANRNVLPAQIELANLYKNGTGVPRDPAKALSWLRKAAEKNYPPAFVALGAAYEQGMGTNKDYA